MIMPRQVPRLRTSNYKQLPRVLYKKEPSHILSVVTRSTFCYM